MSDADLHGVLAEFPSAEELVGAASAMRAKGYTNLDAFSPFPVDGLAEALGFAESKVPLAALIGGIVGAVAAFGMQVATNLDYPLWIGGRPVIAVPAFIIITSEFLLLGAIVAAIGTMLVLNRLPRLNHPVFEAEEFSVGHADRFFLAVLTDKDFDRDKVGKELAGLHPNAIIDLPETRETGA